MLRTRSSLGPRAVPRTPGSTLGHALDDTARRLVDGAVGAVRTRAALPVLGVLVAVTTLLLAPADASLLRFALATFSVLGIACDILLVAERRGLVVREQAAVRGRAFADERLRILVERIPAAVYLDNYRTSDGSFLGSMYVSPQIETITGYSVAEFRRDGDLWASIVHPDDREAVLARDLERDLRGDEIDREYRLIRRDGRTIWIRDQARVVGSSVEEGILSHGYIVDVTDRHLLEEQLEHQAFHDPLTGLANRALFEDRLGHALARSRRAGERVAVLFLDLDRFKTVNDSLGHATGDRLLVEVARRIETALRETDTVARIGGDEFAVLLEELPSADDACLSADRIIAAMRPPIEIDGRRIHCSTSIGISLAGSADDLPSDLLRDADAAMYQAKASDRGGRLLFDPAMHADALDRLELDAALRHAIERDELRLFYQPTVDLADGRVVGVEALLRWRHPVRGLVPPLAFVPIAEETGQIAQIGRWALRRACLQGAAWRRAGTVDADFALSVNVSAGQLRAGFVDEVAEILRATRFPARNLVIEVTESTVVHERERAIETLAELRALGIRIAVDDFGTGYSSLSYLRTLPIDILKIDRSFVSGGETGADQPLLEMLVHLGQVLGLETIAEGVETEAQAGALRLAGCRYGQGYLYGRPLPPSQLARTVRAQSAA